MSREAIANLHAESKSSPEGLLKVGYSLASLLMNSALGPRGLSTSATIERHCNERECLTAAEVVAGGVNPFKGSQRALPAER